jgi:hypothetical protein
MEPLEGSNAEIYGGEACVGIHGNQGVLHGALLVG